MLYNLLTRTISKNDYKNENVLFELMLVFIFVQWNMLSLIKVINSL